MADYRVTPLAPSIVLLLGAALILIVGPVLTPRRRHGLAVVISVLALLSLFFAGSGHPADIELIHFSLPTGASQEGIIEGLSQPTLAFGILLFQPYLWILLLSLLAITLAARRMMERLTPLDQAMHLALVAVACGVVLAGNLPTLASALLLFDATAALFALTARHPRRAVGRLLLGVLSSAAVIGLAYGGESLMARPLEFGALFGLTVWLRLGLYPLVESEASDESPPPTRLGWAVVNLAVGLYLVWVGAPPWPVWLAGTTTLLHGALAWREPIQDRALAHLGYGLAGGILTMAAAVGAGPTSPGLLIRQSARAVEPRLVAASISTLAALVALGLTPSPLGRTELARPKYLWTLLPPLLATASLIAVPLTLGWAGRGGLYQATWDAGALVALALVVVAEGAALSVLYRYWKHLPGKAPAETEGSISAGDQAPTKGAHRTEEQAAATPSQGAVSSLETGSDPQHVGGLWHVLGASVACVPFLIPVFGPRLVVDTPANFASSSVLSALLGLGGSLLWALFLGYGRRRLLESLPLSSQSLASVLRLGWLLRGLGYGLDTLGRIILRVRAAIEGEHYLAWAILLTLGLGLVILLR
jgi:hypothetical protein